MLIIRTLFFGIGCSLALLAGSAVGDAGDSVTPPPTTLGPSAAQLGAEVFGSNGCGFCHENGGKTAGKGPQLMGTARSDSFIVFRIQHGKEAAMPAFGRSLTDAQIANVIAYIRSLKD
jgi:mono/diheme cytochrome c family protein